MTGTGEDRRQADGSRTQTSARARGRASSGWLWTAGAMLMSVALLGPIAAVVGADVGHTYSTLFLTSFGSPFGIGVLLIYSIPLVLVGLAVAVPYRAGLFNIGGEGQLLMGAFTAMVVGVSLPGLGAIPGGVLILLLAGAAAGAFFGAIAGALRAWRGVSEIVTTIMLNFVALFLVRYFVAGPLRDPGLTFNASPAVDPGLRIAKLAGNAGIPMSALVAILAAAVVAWWAYRTRSGWAHRMLGTAPSFARAKGVRVEVGYFLALVAGGALGGLAGATELVGNQYRIGFGFSPGWGIDAVAIALLARGNPLAVVPIAVFFAFLRNGGGALQSAVGIPGTVVTLLAAVPVLIVAAVTGWRTYRKFRGEGG
jgi:ABC-type uncharacterized transport system permease subunit